MASWRQRTETKRFSVRFGVAVFCESEFTTASTNTTAAESRIRDADMSKEMLNFTRLQILTQSGTSMLAQANQLPQSVLSLIRA